MNRPVVYRGQAKRIAFAVRTNGSCPALDFFRSELDEREQARMLWLFQRLGDFGRISNCEQFKHLTGKIFEFKHKQIRMLCFDLPGDLVVVTHGFRKKSPRTPPNEIERAEAIRDEDLSR